MKLAASYSAVAQKCYHSLHASSICEPQFQVIDAYSFTSTKIWFHKPLHGLYMTAQLKTLSLLL